MDRGTDARVADAEPPFEQRLRAEGAEQRDVHRGCHDPPNTEAAGEGSMNLTKQALRKSLPHGPTLFTHLLPRIYACLTPSHAGGCTLSVDPGVVCSFSHSFRSQQPSGWTLPPPSLLLGLPEPHLYATFLWCRSRALS